MLNNINVGDMVNFYDSQMAFRDKDFSGTNPKYYPIGEIVSIYEYKSTYDVTVCDIKIGDRISKSHFIWSVKPIGRSANGM